MNKIPDKRAITEEDVHYVARLSRLSMDDAQAGRFQGQLCEILDYIDQLNEIDTKDILPTSHVLSSMKNVFREDKLRDSLSSEEALSNAPSKTGHFFKVPKIIKDN